MTPARRMVLVGSMALLGAAMGCGAAGMKAAPAEKPKTVDEILKEHEMAAYEAEQRGVSSMDDEEEMAEEEPAPEPSRVDIREEEETIELDTLADADALLARSLERLDDLFGKGKKREDAAARLSAGSSGCVEACKAFASLQRAADAVCRLAGEDTRRCKKARETVEDSERRIAACGCDDE